MKICPSTIALKWEYESPGLNGIPKYERNISDVEMANYNITKMGGGNNQRF